MTRVNLLFVYVCLCEHEQVFKLLITVCVCVCACLCVVTPQWTGDYLKTRDVPYQDASADGRGVPVHRASSGVGGAAGGTVLSALYSLR
jgi:hypothetical protein